MTSFYFLSMSQAASRPNSKVEILYTALRKNHFPEASDITEQNLAVARARGFSNLDERTKMSLMISGLYCLMNGETIVSVAVMKDATIMRLVTMPKYRHKGYASLLVQHIAERLRESGCPCIWSPVAPEVRPLFEKLGWVQVGRSSPDGCLDWCPPWSVETYGQQRRWNPDPWLLHLLAKMVKPTPSGGSGVL
jgi:GNAT superfamily N-acetyltransferase